MMKNIFHLIAAKLTSLSIRKETNAERLLKNTHLFDNASRSEIIAIAKTAKHVQFKAGDLIIKEGDIAESFFIIEKGEVRVFTFNKKGEEIVLARLEEKAYFGEQALLEIEPGRRNASVKSITDCILLEISHQHLIKILNRNKNLIKTLKFVGKQQLIEKLSNQLEIFRAIKGNMIASLAGNVVDFHDQQVIFMKGDVPDNVYFIISGYVDIIVDDAQPDSTVRLGANQLFGELGLLKKRPRSATAKAHGDVTVLVIQPDIFNELYQKTPELRQFIGTLQQVYEVPSRGIVTLYQGTFLGMGTINSAFKLRDGRSVISSRVIEQNIFTISVVDALSTQKIRYEQEDVIRELLIANERVVGATSYGYWSDLGYLCSLILDNKVIEPWQVTLFERTGTLTVAMGEPKDLVCYCMAVERGKIVEAIHSGLKDIDAISKKTSAGSICGACRPKIFAMIGKAAWASVHVSGVRSLHEDIRSYQLKPYSSSLHDYKPGQYIIIQALIDQNWIERSYTLTSVSNLNDYYELTVMREKFGIFSRWLFDNEDKHLLLRVSPPQGKFIFDLQAKNPAVFLAGGIGMVPALASARALVANKSLRRLHLDYSAHNSENLIFLDELMRIAEACLNFTIKTRVTKLEGRLTEIEIKQLTANFPDADFYICGPKGFEDIIIATLKSSGVPDARIKVELFVDSGGAHDVIGKDLL